MTIREQIVEKVKHLPEDILPKVNDIIDKFHVEVTDPETLFQRLKRIRIQAPPDFSENFDLYMNGEKNFDDEMRKLEEK